MPPSAGLRRTFLQPAFLQPHTDRRVSITQGESSPTPCLHLFTLAKSQQRRAGCFAVAAIESDCYFRSHDMEVPGQVPHSINCHACNAVIDLTGHQAFHHVECPQCGAVSVVPLQFGNFLLLNPLGVGGLGTVYKAVDLALGRSLALKILRKKFASQPEFIDSFFREARAAAAVTHPNIAQVYSFGEHEGQYYLAMELLERGSLDDRISTLGKLPEKDVLEIGRQIAAGLRAAHARGLLHRDIKPGNILFGEDNIPKLVDFGLARAQHEAHLDAGGPIWGTPYYIAPEKLRGQPEDHRSDMYSLGATLYHALAGRPPFHAETASKVVTKHATQPAQSLRTYVPTVQNATAHLIGRMLSKNPAERHATYDELLHDFEEAIAAVKYAEQNRVVTAPSGEQFSMRSLLATGVIVVVGLGVMAWVFLHRDRLFGPPTKPTPSAEPTGPVSVTPTFAPTPVAPSPSPATNGLPTWSTVTVNFAEEAAWTRAWHQAILNLTQNKYQEALVAFDTAARTLGPGRPKERQWITYMEGLTLLVMDLPTDALARFGRAMDLNAPRAIPESFTTGTLIDLLAFLMAGDIPPSTVETALPNMPPWARALTAFSLGLKYLENADLTRAVYFLEFYVNLPPDDTERWAFNLRPLADRIVRNCQRTEELLAEVTRLRRDGHVAEAMQKITTAIEARQTMRVLRPLLEKHRAELQAELDRLEQEAAAAREREEQLRRERKAREQQRAEEEARLLQALEPEITPLLQRYDFTGLQERYQRFSEQVITTLGRKLLAERQHATTWLIEFKNQLAADFAAQPVDASALRTRGGTALIGRLARASDTEVYYRTDYGEIVGRWADLPPATLIQLATQYAANLGAKEPPEKRARRYLMLAIFCRTYGQSRQAATFAAQAIELSPAMETEWQKTGGSVPPVP